MDDIRECAVCRKVAIAEAPGWYRLSYTHPDGVNRWHRDFCSMRCVKELTQALPDDHGSPA